MSTPSVWIVNKGNHPYESAEKFGTLKVLTEGRVNIFAMDNLCKEIWTKLEEGRATDRDYILVSGYAVPNMIAENWFCTRFGRCRLLLWGANRLEYTALTLNSYRGAGRE